MSGCPTTDDDSDARALACDVLTEMIADIRIETEGRIGPFRELELAMYIKERLNDSSNKPND